MFSFEMKTLAQIAVVSTLVSRGLAWGVALANDGECESTPVFGASGTNNDLKNCTEIGTQAGFFEVNDMQNCMFEVYRSETDCRNGNVDNFFNSVDDDNCNQWDNAWTWVTLQNC